MPFPVLLGRAHALGATGVAAVGDEKFVYFLRGKPIHVDSLDAEETSEVYMTRRLPAPVDTDRLAAARAVARDSGRGVGEALLGLGVLDPNELFELKRSHARQKLVGCFGLTAGAVRVEPRAGFGAEILPMPVDVLDAIREGLGRFYDRDRAEAAGPAPIPARAHARPGVQRRHAPPGAAREHRALRSTHRTRT